MDTVKWVTDNLERVKAPEMGIKVCSSGEKDGKTYGTIKFYTHEGCEEYWISAFFNNAHFKTKVVGKTIIFWATEKKVTGEG